MIINLHGFKSHGNNSKYEVLARHFGEDSVFSPTLPASPFEAVALVESYLSRYSGSTPVLVGTSLGGFYAYVLHNRHGIPTHLINPSFTPWNTLNNQLGSHIRFDTGEAFEWTSQYVDELRDLGSEMSQLANARPKLTFYLGENDEVIDHAYLHNEFPECKKIWTDDTHRFSQENVERLVIPEIRVQRSPM
jgi:uncharacterized protein